jgi:hypothetical protein
MDDGAVHMKKPMNAWGQQACELAIPIMYGFLIIENGHTMDDLLP